MDSLLPKSKVCSKCGEEKLLGEFSKQERGKYGRGSLCKVCRQQYYRRYNQENKQKRAEQQKQYYEANKDKLKTRRNKWTRNERKNNEQYRIRKNLNRNLHHVLNNIGKRKNASILTYIGCSIEYLQEHLNSTKKPNWGDDLHIDHIIPKTSFDHTNEQEIKKCWNWRNLRYLPAEENMSKKDKLDMDLVKSYGIEDLLPVGVDK